ncbi:MAG TPA: SDR family oxidoreductase [Rhodospirillaceae bacterium]|nr:SDR family oxidoreductase [Rhodospirillaceae bacterium]
MADPSGKTALITGAAHRIGRALALALARKGWTIAVHYRQSAAAAEALLDELAEAGGRGIALSGDLMCEDEVLGLVPRAVERVGPLSLLVNNASLFEPDGALTATRSLWDAHLETNLRAPFVLTQSFAAQLPEHMQGNVVNVIDQRVLNLTPHFMTYTLSKAALWALTQTLALALAPSIRVNAIGPGPALPSIRQTALQFERQCQAMPLRQGTSPGEIAEALLFILASTSMTGQMIALDGGQHLCWAPAGQTPEE